jgi:anti-sigma B factor antagonist
MEIKSHTAGDIVVMELEGRFDAYSAPQANEWLEEAITNRRPPNVIVNLENVVFVDSTALATLVQAMKRCRQLDGDLRLSNLKQPVRMIFELTRLDRAFEIFNLEEEAAGAFNP